MEPSVSHDRQSESPAVKARWFQSLTVAERMDMLCWFTDLAVEAHPELLRGNDVQPVEGRMQVLSLKDVRRRDMESSESLKAD